MEQCTKLYEQPKSQVAAYAWWLEKIRFADRNKRAELNVLIAELAKSNVTFSTTIGLLHNQLRISSILGADKKATPELVERYNPNFKILMKYAKRMHEDGILLRIGTDTKYGGKTLLSEMSLMCENGFSTEAAFKIATLNGAKAMGIDLHTGTIEEGKRANLLVWDRDPLKHYKTIMRGRRSSKMVLFFLQLSNLNFEGEHNHFGLTCHLLTNDANIGFSMI